jgi:hypothetical protein
MQPLPTGYRTATADGHRIVIYRDLDQVGEVTAPTNATHQELIALEDKAAAFAIAHARKAEAHAQADVAEQPTPKKRKAAEDA